MVGDDGVPRVVDFGIAKASGRLQRKTMNGLVRGEVAYMAPEQLEALDVDRRADIFALGVVLWESVVGSRSAHPASSSTRSRVRTRPRLIRSRQRR